jgi:DNA-binding MarR family transcriptional regulator
MDKKLKAYASFLKQQMAINESFDLTWIQIRILNKLLIAFYEERELKVTDLIAFKDIASPATMHSHLKGLVQKKLVIQTVGTDSRAKYSQLTKSAINRFTKLANAK